MPFDFEFDSKDFDEGFSVVFAGVSMDWTWSTDSGLVAGAVGATTFGLNN